MERVILTIIFAVVAGYFFSSDDSSMAGLMFIVFAGLASSGYLDLDNKDDEVNVDNKKVLSSRPKQT